MVVSRCPYSGMKEKCSRRSALTGISLLALTLALSTVSTPSAWAACPNVTGTETTTQNLAAGDTCTVTGSGHIDVSGTPGALGIDGAGDNTVTIEAGGRITTSGSFAHAIRILGNDNTIDNSGTITTEGDYADGISAGNSNTIDNSGTITTKGRRANGISAGNSNTIDNSGTITTEGYGADGILAISDNVIGNSGTITTEGSSAHGLLAISDNVIDNSGAITTKGLESDGISAGNSNIIDNFGTITTEGKYADGISADSHNIITSSGSISTTGDFTYGIQARYENTITNSGDISATGYFGWGIYVRSGSTVINSGDISATGDFAGGIYAGGDNTVTNSGNISASGTGISASGDNNLVANNGDISITNDGGVGIFAGDDNTITNSGNISATGDLASGIYVMNGNAITNGGDITTTGDDAVGVRLTGRGNVVTNSGKIFSARGWGVGANPTASSSPRANSITNSGLIRGLLDPSTSAATGAISFADTDNILTLDPGSVLIGLVRLGDDTTVNINTRLPTILYVDNLASGTFNSATHSIYQDAANSRVIAFNSNLLENNSGAMSAKLLGDGVSSILFGGEASTTVVTAAAAGGPARQRALNTARASVLAGGFVNRGKNKDPALWSTAYGGLMALRFHPVPEFFIGVHGGTGRTKTEGGKSRASWFGGVHARYENDGYWLAGLLTAGRTGAGGSITFLDNFSSTGYRTFALSGRSKFISGETRLGFKLAMPKAPFTLSPELMARVTRLNSRVQVNGLSMLPSGGGKSTAFDGRAQITAAFDLMPTMPEQQARLFLTSGLALHDEEGSRNDRVTGFGGMKLQMRMAENVSFFVAGESHVGKGGFVGVAGNVGLNVQF